MNEPVYHLEGVVHARAESLEDFDGPLDVIFLLLSKNKIEIQDVSISSILEQYLAYLDEMKRMDVEIASEFTAMASHLMLIKTKMLLSAAEQEEAMSEMELLIQSLEQRQRKEAYGKIQGAAQFLLRATRSALACSSRNRSRFSAITPTATGTTGRTCCWPYRPLRNGRHGFCRRPRRISRALSVRSRIRSRSRRRRCCGA